MSTIETERISYYWQQLKLEQKSNHKINTQSTYLLNQLDVKERRKRLEGFKAFHSSVLQIILLIQ